MYPPSWATLVPPYDPFYTWANRGGSGFSGEYEISLARHPWDAYSIMGPGLGLHVSYGMEIVSFPFTPDCAFSPTGCSGLAGTADRNLYMPSDSYDPPPIDAWGGLSNNFYQPEFKNTNDQTLASNAFYRNLPLGFSSTDKILPHTIIKHTVYVHCGPLTVGPPYPDIEYSFSWIYDNTRGRMRYYPFCSCNGCPGSCTESEYDITFSPEILYKKDYFGHYYYENDNTILLQYGTLDYFPFPELQGLPTCNYSPQMTIPSSNDKYTTLGISYSHPYFPPYSLISSPALQWKGNNLAGYENGPNNTLISMGGIKHTYHIDRNIDLNIINHIDKIIYNPSEVYVTANNLIFPTGYTFKTILGRYPSAAEVSDADNNPKNGGPYTDPRKVPVPVNANELMPLGGNASDYPEVSWDDPSTQDIDERYGYYYIENLGQITVEPCVKIFDAKFEVKQGGTLVFIDYTQTINPDRFTISGTGGAIAKNFLDIQYLQNTRVTQPQHIPYKAMHAIYAGRDVDPKPGATIAPYILEPGSNVEFIAGDKINLQNGFGAKQGSLFHAQCRNLIYPTCPNGWESARSANNSIVQMNQMPSLKISPNPVKDHVIIRNDDLVSGTLEIIDIMGRMLIKQPFEEHAELNISNFNPGIYIARVFNEKGIGINGNIIKQ